MSTSEKHEQRLSGTDSKDAQNDVKADVTSKPEGKTDGGDTPDKPAKYPGVERKVAQKESLSRTYSWSTIMQAAVRAPEQETEKPENEHSQDQASGGTTDEKKALSSLRPDSEKDNSSPALSPAPPSQGSMAHSSSNYPDVSDISELNSRSSTPFPDSSFLARTPTDKDRSNEDTQSEIQNIIEQFKDTTVSEREEKEARASEIERARQSRQQNQFPNRTSSLQSIDPSQYVVQHDANDSGGRPEATGNGHSNGTAQTRQTNRPSSPQVLAPPPPSERDLPFDFHRFLEQLRHRTADPVARFLRSFLNEFGKKQWLVHEQVKLVGDFLAFISGKMAQCDVWREVSDVEFDNAREGMEKLVMNRLYTQTFSPAIPPPPNPPRSLSRSRRREFERARGPGRRGQHQEDVERDEVLAQKIRIYGWITEEHLDIPPLVSNGKRFLSLAQQELVKINAYRAPRDKVICILNCCKVIFGLLKHAKASDTSADSFLPLLIYTVLKANPEHLVSNIQYIFRFRNQDKLTGEAGYYLSSLSGAVQFIETLDRTGLTITDEEFEKNVEAAVSTIAKKDRERERASFEAQERERERREQKERRATSQRRVLQDSRNSSRARRDSNNENNSYEESPVTGILRSIQKPLSTLGRIFTDESDSSAEPLSPPSSPLRPPPDARQPLVAQHVEPERSTTPGRQQQRESSQPERLSAEESRARQASRQEIRRAVSHEENVIAAEARRIQRNEHHDVIETLSSMFPNLDRDVIDDVVKVKGGSIGDPRPKCHTPEPKSSFPQCVSTVKMRYCRNYSESVEKYPEYDDDAAAMWDQKEKDEAAARARAHAQRASEQRESGASEAREPPQLSREEADRLYEERMEEEYAKREGGA
ncbi:hypothetical protein KEM56_003843 [Ascosphaera pollenicola]|nr:hypothetical protein KEM56_003843 [Ascosphaera pollenicola]